jgi:hydroxypyruvate reductase
MMSQGPHAPILDPGRLLREAFVAAIDAASPARCVPPALPVRPSGRTIVVGAGKAAAAMARAVEQHWQGDLGGTVVTAHGHAVRCQRIEVLESAHPVPAAEGQRAAVRLFERVRGSGPDDLVLCLVSGGASALLPLPAVGLGLEDKQAVTRALLRSGAAIGEINTVRRHLSRIKGGRLGVACHPARLVTLDLRRPGTIRTCPGRRWATRPAPMRSRYRRHESQFGGSTGARRGTWESVKPGDPRLARAGSGSSRHRAPPSGRGAGLTRTACGPSSSDRLEARRAKSVARWRSSRGGSSSSEPARACVLSPAADNVSLRRRHAGATSSSCWH